MKKLVYRGFQIHYVTGNGKVAPRWKYDIYNQGLYYNSANTLDEAKKYVHAVLWTRRHIPS